MTPAPNAEAAGRLDQPRAVRRTAAGGSRAGARGERSCSLGGRARGAGGASAQDRARAERGWSSRAAAAALGDAVASPGRRVGRAGPRPRRRGSGGDQDCGHGDPRQPGVLRPSEQDQDQEEALRGSESEAVPGQRPAAQRAHVGGQPLGKSPLQRAPLAPRAQPSQLCFSCGSGGRAGTSGRLARWVPGPPAARLSGCP